jgi:hypothetical protein
VHVADISMESLLFGLIIYQHKHNVFINLNNASVKNILETNVIKRTTLYVKRANKIPTKILSIKNTLRNGENYPENELRKNYVYSRA